MRIRILALLVLALFVDAPSDAIEAPPPPDSRESFSGKVDMLSGTSASMRRSPGKVWMATFR